MAVAWSLEVDKKLKKIRSTDKLLSLVCRSRPPLLFLTTYLPVKGCSIGTYRYSPRCANYRKKISIGTYRYSPRCASYDKEIKKKTSHVILRLSLSSGLGEGIGVRQRRLKMKLDT